MATYELDDISFYVDGELVIANAGILKDGILLQSFSVKAKKTSDARELSAVVVRRAKDIILRHAQRITLHERMMAGVLEEAEAWLTGQSWDA
jgi:hypothetical protein